MEEVIAGAGADRPQVQNGLEVVVVQTASDERGELQCMATQLVESRLVACAQIVGPTSSYYRWLGELQESQEWLLYLKTTAKHSCSVVEAIVELHHYELPEVVVMGVSGGHLPYLKWIVEETD